MLLHSTNCVAARVVTGVAARLLTMLLHVAQLHQVSIPTDKVPDAGQQPVLREAKDRRRWPHPVGRMQ